MLYDIEAERLPQRPDKVNYTVPDRNTTLAAAEKENSRRKKNVMSCFTQRTSRSSALVVAVGERRTYSLQRLMVFSSLLLLLLQESKAFVVRPTISFASCTATRARPTSVLLFDSNEARRNDKASSNGNDETNEILDDLTWRAEKVRLEEANTKSFLKRRPRYVSQRRSAGIAIFEPDGL